MFLCVWLHAQSFETELDADKRVLGEGGDPCKALFIRAPAIMKVTDPSVEPLASLMDEAGETVIVAA